MRSPSFRLARGRCCSRRQAIASRNANVVLQAVPGAGQDFSVGAERRAAQNPLVVTMTSNMVLTAGFTQRPQLQEGDPELLSQDGFRVTLTGEWGTPYRIDCSTNLTEWTPLTTLTNWFRNSSVHGWSGHESAVPVLSGRDTTLEPGQFSSNHEIPEPHERNLAWQSRNQSR